MNDFVIEQIKWIPITSEERPPKYEEVLVVADRWSTIVDEWIENDVLKTRWNGKTFDICKQWSPEHMPRIKYWALMPVGPEQEEEL